ncbi:MAG TPA: RagB/SusD family nutrient uptake outer membrane protein [Longimicrobiales bacterium]|nr:RagB/SusD family nutrient uptake outer membrane protein [Longimicrobiales bacterium]
MTTKQMLRARSPRRRAASALGAAVLALAAGLAGCNGLLDVKNPNDLKSDDLKNPDAASAQANGALSTVARAWSRMLMAQGAITDELKWVGSYDAGRELDQGFLNNLTNDFNNVEGFPYVAEARWTADAAVKQLEEFDKAGTLKDRTDLARAYLYAAVAYGMVADNYADFALSDRQEAAPAVGPANMSTLYDTEVGYLGKALTIAQGKNNDLTATILAQRSRAKFAKAVWQKTHPAGTVPSNPLINDAGVVADAKASLALTAATPDWRYQFTYAANTIANQLGAWINSRQEFRIGDVYGIPAASDKKITGIRLQDPIDKKADPAVTRFQAEFTALSDYGPATVVSARELHLMLAEAALAAGDNATFTTEVNAVRAVDNLTPYGGQIPALDMLKYERQANLFLQGKRLADLYRFGIRLPEWLSNSDAVLKPGTYLPIPSVEVLANCHLSGSC